MRAELAPEKMLSASAGLYFGDKKPKLRPAGARWRLCEDFTDIAWLSASLTVE